jgi:putative serine protease PepD
VLAAVLAAGLLGGGAGALADRALAGNRTVVSAIAAPPLSARDAASAPAGSVQQVAAAVLPSVVSVEVQRPEGPAEGSGAVLTSDGLILTNNHVVAPATDGGSGGGPNGGSGGGPNGGSGGGRITVTFHDGTSTNATIVGRDPTSDLAVIRAARVHDLRPVAFGRSSDLQVGQGVVAIGSPLGLSGTVTSGIVSALNRPVRTGEAQRSGQDTVIDAIQTDAAINPGNSGGPLVNMQGEVVGVNSAIASLGVGQGGESGSIGLGFAIPSDEAQPIAQQLAQTGKASHAQLGVSVRDTERGGQLMQVQANGPAARAGLRAADVIVKVGDRPVDGADALVAAVRSHRPGEQVQVTYLRGGQTKTTMVTLGSSG